MSAEDQEREEITRQLELQDEQLKQIEREQKATPLVADRVPFATVIAEYDAASSPDFYKKANELAEVYGEIRHIRGDGNCFYRAVLVGIIETILRNEDVAKKYYEDTKTWSQRLVKLGFPDWTTEDFCQYYDEWLQKLVSKETPTDAIIPGLNDDGHSNYLLIFLRLITSGYLKEHSEDYAPFIDEGRSLADYCATEIEAMWKDADHLAITGLALATGFKIRIEYMDQTAAPNGGFHYEIPHEFDGNPDIVLLYRPGHYDVLYKK